MKQNGVVQAFDRMRQDYNATKAGRHRRSVAGLPLDGASADYHYRSESQYLRIVEMVRDYERNEPIVRAAFNRLTSNVVQCGFTLDVDTGDKELDQRLTDAWHDWADDPRKCDAAGERTFNEQEQLAFRSMVRDGDVCAVGLSDGRLRWYEAHRLRTPKNTSKNVVHGVLLDGLRNHKEFWFTKEELSPYTAVSRVSDMVRVPARNQLGDRQVFHIYHPDRFSQTRGISWCIPSADTISMHGDIEFAKMVQQKVVSCYSIFLKRPVDWDFDAENANSEQEPSRSDYINGLQRTLTDLFPGKIIEGLPGEELQGFSPNVPNPEFFQHAMLLLTFIAANLDLPLQVLLLDPTKTNFSGWRGAIDQARLRFQQMQRNLVARLHAPLYRFKVRQWIREFPWLQETIQSGSGDPFKHKWHSPAWDYIEPLTDAKADALVLASSLNSLRRVMARRGLRSDLVSQEMIQDNGLLLDLAIDEAVRLNRKHAAALQEFGLPYIDWHEVARMPLPQGLTMSLDATQEAEGSSDEAIPDD